MKSKSLLAAFALLIASGVYAQKDEMKAVEKAMKDPNPQVLKTALQNAEFILNSGTDADKAQFLFIKGNALLNLADKLPTEKGKSLIQASKAYQELIALEKTMGKAKYSSQATSSLATLKDKLLGAAIDDNNAKRFKEGTEKLYTIYTLNPKDTIYLYYAASGAVNAQDYDLALTYYEDLKKLNYSGKGVSYLATDKITKEEISFSSKSERDLYVGKMGTHEKPRDEKIPSKRGEILRNYALILVQKGENAKAMAAVQEARKTNPEDYSLALTEANLYLEAQDFASYTRIIEDVIKTNPNEPDLYYNLGVILSKANKIDEAEKNYLRAIEINPKYTNAYLNLAILKLDLDTKIVEEMNSLGTSAKDNKRYEELKKEREKVFKATLPYLEKVVELEPGNKDAKQTLLNVYSSLDYSDKYKALKATME